MPAELSEQGFHTNFEQGARNLNAEFKSLVAISFYLSMLDYWGIPRPPVNTLAGIVRDEDNARPLNGVRLELPDGHSYTTDTYESLFHNYSARNDSVANGFYYFEQTSNGEVQLSVAATHYADTTLCIAISDTFITFQDVELISTIPPFIKYATPAPGDTAVSILEPIRLSFSRSMDGASVQNALVIEPPLNAKFAWFNSEHHLVITPAAPLPMSTAYQIKIDATAVDRRGHQLDGDHDGVAGDDYVLHFKTAAVDEFPPIVMRSIPADQADAVETEAILTVEFNEMLDPASVNATNVYCIDEYQDEVPGRVRYYDVGYRGVVCFFPSLSLPPYSEYQLSLERSITDVWGNPLEKLTAITFRTAAPSPDFCWLDDFDAGIGNWTLGAESQGILSDSTRLVSDSLFITLSRWQSTHSLGLRYFWDETSPTGAIQLSFQTPEGQAAQFDTSAVLQARIFGDGGQNRFRFRLSEAAGAEEVSLWKAMDWRGWCSATWDLGSEAPDAAFAGGNGELAGPFSLAGLEIERTEASASSGWLYFDDLGIQGKTTSVETALSGAQPAFYELRQNFPNPFNSTTAIRFQLPERNVVDISVYNLRGQEIKRLISKVVAAGEYQVEWNGTDEQNANLASGVYVIRMHAGRFQASRKVVLLR